MCKHIKKVSNLEKKIVTLLCDIISNTPFALLKNKEHIL